MDTSPGTFLLEDEFDPQKYERKKRLKRWLMIGGVCVVVLLALGLIIGLLVPKHKTHRPLNVIIMIGDGFGPAAATMARLAQAHMNGVPFMPLKLDAHLVGTVRTASYSSDVTDSAAGATAYATGYHTNNDAVSVDHNYKPVGTLFEAARIKGMRTGVITTTRVTDATPACFYAHSTTRKTEGFIAAQMMDKDLTVALGGGSQFFNQTLMDMALANQYTIVNNRTDMLGVTKGKILGLFTPHDLPYDIDRINQNMTEIPSLKDMTIKALELLAQDNEHGFIIMVEGAKIDLAGHSNDAATQIYETLNFDDTFNTVLEFAAKDKNTLVLATADHETGGLTLGFQPDPHVYPTYRWLPDVLLNFTGSAATMGKEIFATNVTGASAATNISVINSVVNKYYTPGNWDQSPYNFTTGELDLLQSFWSQNSNSSFAYFLGRFMSQRALIGFTTTGHTGVDVNLYSYYSGDDSDLKQALVEKLHANVENIDVAQFIEDMLDLDLETVTLSLVNFNPGVIPPFPPS
ncbi:hypothetical protein SAMD00019534_124890 [Acytostelium subglobosum LB1]|uniref:hypothetical protein n=1 Tax=Acytostelium subglobosum LB1 TaxID=1410327 RepID=UPI00064508B3|nr:hypothetical protein SAMD00019534_124890 [Acytostelium subglobosum LB1]GAM29313.1 hypothetical protein SAMD00019534_124890 [Acytostelium subglobosum LB1]|eukprot:XP_012747740.1 hypothetical protein SAMD00019534_124890 [Acytostelium subglobosum LB1]